MFRFGLLLLAAVASLLGALALCQAGWLETQPERTKTQVQTEDADSARLPIAVRYRQGQRRHWRMCLLNQ
jgi:hypothetical protein